MVIDSSDPHPRVALLSCRPSTGAAKARISQCSQYVSRSSTEATTGSRVDVEGRREPDWDRGNERCQLVKRTQRAGFDVLVEDHSVPWIRPETACDISRRRVGPASGRAGLDC